eukprot:scaffold26472_cov162-Cylindrotheca_fusiformis.AAC.3
MTYVVDSNRRSIAGYSFPLSLPDVIAASRGFAQSAVYGHFKSFQTSRLTQEVSLVSRLCGAGGFRLTWLYGETKGDMMDSSPILSVHFAP